VCAIPQGYSTDFSYQPVSPTPEATIVSWETVYGPRSPMAVDQNGQTMLQMVPRGMTVYFDPQNHWVWTTEGRRVKLSEKKMPEAGDQPQHMQPQRRPELHVQPYPPTMRRHR